ncbi:2-hydroxymuconate tautomerase family protein [Paenibacillus puerhi]|uniref:2-hydroxymuconate tautomerase family protein n=1 Tax=Paenibacillus puerhi TaxID=2692622 RepID=UPI001356755D|nr:2-hydroxymuconate tautomerase family protein [Paenibacillus puerhi]
MPFVNIRIVKDVVTADQKSQLIQGVTDLLVRILDKDPKQTVVIIDEVSTDNWGIDGKSVTEINTSI